MMAYLAGDEFLTDLPPLLAGPALRRTDPTGVTVWVALKFACTVKLQVLTTEHNGQLLGAPVLQGQRETVAIGQHLHIAAVTACPMAQREQLEKQQLHHGVIYAYDLQFVTDKTYSLTEALRSSRVPTATVSYFDHQKPTFSLPPAHIADLKIVHGSCRKPHGAGFDTLPLLDCLLETAASQPKERPHQLFLTGDQVYGDDVADPLQWVATALGDTLLGWEESLPIDGHTTLTPKQLPVGKRAPLVTHQAGLTAGLDNKEEKVTSHFLSFGEYCALYLLERSPVCWPVDLPPGKEMTTGHKAMRRWDQDRRHMQQFMHTLWKVRRALANIATYTIFDDHDVSDDWNLNQAWCLRVLGRPLGYRAVQNALLSYAICQAWGNTPRQFEADRSGGKLLMAVQRWSRSGGNDQEAESAIATYLGLPPINTQTGLPEFTQDGDCWVLKRSPASLRWHYTLHSPCHEVVVLDTRTRRGYPIEAKPIAPPMLLCPSAFDQQLSQPLKQLARARHRQPTTLNPTPLPVTFVVASTNIISMKVLDWIQVWQLKNGKVFSADVGDSWNLNNPALATLLTKLFQQRQTVLVLSGDIHYSSGVRLSHQDMGTGQESVLVQLVSSAIKNQELLTQILHTRLKQWLLPEKPRQWVGWSQPPHMQEIKQSSRRDLSKSLAKPPQWQCHTQWLQRQRTQSANISPDLFWLVPPHRSSHQTLIPQWLKFWQARWFQSGQEVVGMNNIALVHFDMEPGEEPGEVSGQSAKPLTVLQDHYWFSSQLPREIVHSCFQTTL
ncbi:alkaline phosphatase D family protein [Leptolyngbya ectocarpi]|nr:PhoD-like phosphatase [Leptolyngbya ectocarpi]